MECFSIDTVETGRKIKKLCSTNKITVSRLSEFLGISEQAIYKWLRGDCAPTLDNCWNMSRLFGVHVVGAGICMIKEPEIIKAYKYSSGAGNAAKRGAGAVARAGLRIASKGLL